MGSKGVISKLTQPTEWVNSIVIMEKPNNKGIRIYLDPNGPPHALEPEQCRSKTLKEMMAKLTECLLNIYFQTFVNKDGSEQ